MRRQLRRADERDQFLQVFRFQELEEPKPGYVVDWPDLPSWQQGTDADIFEAIEKACS
ncbi:hypothetical protein [Streptomyces sp. NPDC093544]|uniref:hypothetical protein n=1 Tax=Streptomyces sp. NPDC093544 TaxID=3155200 RepID=UPI0034457616